MRLNLTAAAIVVASGAAVLVPSIASAQYYERVCETRYRNVRIPYQDQVCGGYGYDGYGGGCRYVTKYRYDRQPYEHCYRKQVYRGGGYGGGGHYGGGGGYSGGGGYGGGGY